MKEVGPRARAHVCACAHTRKRACVRTWLTRPGARRTPLAGCVGRAPGSQRPGARVRSLCVLTSPLDLVAACVELAALCVCRVIPCDRAASVGACPEPTGSMGRGDLRGRGRRRSPRAAAVGARRDPTSSMGRGDLRGRGQRRSPRAAAVGALPDPARPVGRGDLQVRSGRRPPRAAAVGARPRRPSVRDVGPRARTHVCACLHARERACVRTWFTRPGARRTPWAGCVGAGAWVPVAGCAGAVAVCAGFGRVRRVRAHAQGSGACAGFGCVRRVRACAPGGWPGRKRRSFGVSRELLPRAHCSSARWPPTGILHR